MARRDGNKHYRAKLNTRTGELTPEEGWERREAKRVQEARRRRSTVPDRYVSA